MLKLLKALGRATADTIWPTRRLQTKTGPKGLPWTAPVEFKSKLGVAEAKFIFEQAEIMLKDSVTTSENIVSRTNSVLTWIVGSMIALSGYVFTQLGTPPHFDKILLAPCFGITYLYFLARGAFFNNEPKDYLLPGSLPRDLFGEQYFRDELQQEFLLLIYYVNQAENAQYKIEVNSEINEKRWANYSRIVRRLILLPLLLMFLWILLIAV